jgi:large subunit ribosomal protein L24
MPQHVRKGDLVYVRTGRDRGRTGTVLRVLPKEDKVLVQGMNMVRKHVKPSQQNPQGGIIEKEMPIHISNVSPSVNGKPTRVRFETRKDGSKVRIAVRTGEVLGQPLKKAK